MKYFPLVEGEHVRMSKKFFFFNKGKEKKSIRRSSVYVGALQRFIVKEF